MRFELTSPRELAVFKTAPFDRSGTPPRKRFTGHRAAFVGETLYGALAREQSGHDPSRTGKT